MESIENDIEAVQNIKFASIGPVTSETMKNMGFQLTLKQRFTMLMELLKL